MGLLGQDWSMGNLKGKLGGLLSDPEKQTALLQNPMFNAGMGLLSENSKPFGGNPAMGVLSGLKSAQETEQQQADRKRIEELRAQIAELIKQQMGGGAYPPGVMSPQGGMMTPTQQPPPSIMDLKR